MPILPELPEDMARILAKTMVYHSPDEGRREFVVDGVVAGAAYDEVIVITYERKHKPPTLEFGIKDE